MATATFWQRGETIDRINDTAKTIPANTIQAIGKRIGVVAMEAAPGQKYSVTKSVKEESGYTSPFCYPLWPCDRVGEYILAKSAVAGAMIQYMA